MSPQTSAAIAAAGATATYRGVWPAPFSSVARPPGNVASGWPLHRLPGDGGSRERPVLPLPAGGLPNIAGDVEAGWDVWIANDATANLTVDGNGAETIDGSANLTVAAGAAVRLQSPDR